MVNVLEVIQDPDMGFTAFSIYRTYFRRQRGSLVPSNEIIAADGAVHPGIPEEISLLPEEMQRNEFITVYTAYELSTGENNSYGQTYRAADVIGYDGKYWRLIKSRDYSSGGYYQGVAMRIGVDEFQNSQQVSPVGG